MSRLLERVVFRRLATPVCKHFHEIHATPRNQSATNSRKCGTWPSYRAARPGFDARRKLACRAGASNSGQVAPNENSGADRSWALDTLKKMLLFMGPCLVIPMAEPVTLLFDTVAVGQFAGTTDLAALGPANVVISFAQYVFQSLQVATISLVATKLRDDRDEEAAIILSHALALAMLSGVIVTIILEVFAVQLLTMTGADPSLVPLSVSYLRIRALSMPAALTVMVATSGLLAQKNSLLPSLVVMLMCGMSLLGDTVMVAVLKWGITGAAMAAATSQYIGAMLLLWGLATHSKIRPQPRLPSLHDLQVFIATMGPLSIAYFCKNFTYIIIHTSATSLRPLLLAAHQAVFSIWNFCAFLSGPLEQAALAFIPAAATSWQRHVTSLMLLLGGALVGALTGLICACCVIWQPQIFSQDPALWPVISSVALQVALSLTFTGIDVSSNGVLLARGRAPYVARSFAVSMLLVAGFMHFARMHGWELAGVWWGVVVFFGTRAVQSASMAASLVAAPKSAPLPA